MYNGELIAIESPFNLKKSFGDKFKVKNPTLEDVFIRSIANYRDEVLKNNVI
jgi:hypothetical protein